MNMPLIIYLLYQDKYTSLICLIQNLYYKITLNTTIDIVSTIPRKNYKHRSPVYNSTVILGSCPAIRQGSDTEIFSYSAAHQMFLTSLFRSLQVFKYCRCFVLAYFNVLPSALLEGRGHCVLFPQWLFPCHNRESRVY